MFHCLKYLGEYYDNARQLQTEYIGIYSGMLILG